MLTCMCDEPLQKHFLECTVCPRLLQQHHCGQMLCCTPLTQPPTPDHSRPSTLHTCTSVPPWVCCLPLLPSATSPLQGTVLQKQCAPTCCCWGALRPALTRHPQTRTLLHPSWQTPLQPHLHVHCVKPLCHFSNLYSRCSAGSKQWMQNAC